ncbi:citrate synthase [Kribbella steppae]|uniref:Citrate synthase n=1 Tax=Kribbella steppae TaxID=2512223 RepID=A0A4R2GSC8_9ACTN|nr:citrate synthase [Kribbella steppae]
MSALGQSEQIPTGDPGLEADPDSTSLAVKIAVRSASRRLTITLTHQAMAPASEEGIVTDQSLTVRDNRTGKDFDLAITDGTIRAADLKQISASDGDGGLATYDPGFVNTASCRSSVTFIDGDKGILEYRGYPIEQLAEQSNYLEVAYLLVNGKLPNKAEYEAWAHDVTYHTFVHENLKTFMQGFRYDAHPMGMLAASVGALSTFYPESRNIFDEESRALQIRRLIAKMPTLGAFAFRHAQGKPYVYPDNELSYTANFLSMLFKMSEPKYAADDRLVRALEILFILHADHEQNASTNAVRAIGSTQVDPYTAVAGGIGALYGPLHGGANEAVLKMLRRIGSVDNVPSFIEGVKNGDERLMGFGHRVYKNYDPRAKIIKKAADDVFEVTGINPLLKIAVELEKIALEDEYFVSRKLYPNVDFYSGLIYEALEFPPEMFTVLFAIPRTSGWLAQWLEMLGDTDQKIARPKQIYTGERGVQYVPMGDR